MAGIAGIVYRKNKNEKSLKLKAGFYKKQVKSMLDTISHRGIRQKSTMFMENAGLGAATGFISNYGEANISQNNLKNNECRNHKEDKVCRLLLDGKIYNSDKLYLQYGQNFKQSKSQLHKLKELIGCFNTDILKKMDGQFAMFYSDIDKNIYLARDFLGRKPLYFGHIKGSDVLYFASEVKAISKFCSNFSALAPGHFIKNTGSPVMFRKLDQNKYENDFSEETYKKASFDKNDDAVIIAEKIENLLLRAIEKRIPSESPDIKIGSWLSGGLDSSIIAALLKHFSKNVYTFAVGFRGSKDLEAARVVAKYLGTEHTEYILDEDDLFKRVPYTVFTLESFDAPLVRSTLGNIIVSKMSAGTDIVFSGEGGDEIFAGYNYFLNFSSNRQIQSGLISAINSLHNTALQRVDRSSNRYGVNVKLPMLDEELIDFVLSIPPKYKLDYENGLTKCILRTLAEKYLPQDIVYRPKDKFWEGSGINNTIENKIEQVISDIEYEKEKVLENGFMLRSKEELYYYKIFKNFYPEVEFKKFLSFTQNFN
ncbi:MAG: hypothetical protein JW997_06770 [Actinobacteria bacterium]|nr:hypothetical protein [Actinomycetota bacterium]